MAFWYDLPAEVKQNILEHLVVGLHVKFEPRHAATRATRNAKQEEKDKETDSTSANGLNMLLLVSKNFLTYNELEGALLTNATICILDLRAFNTLEKRYGKLGLAMITKMVIDPKMTSYAMARAGTKFPELHAYMKTKTSNMQRITISLIHRFPELFDTYLTFAQAVKIAGGHLLRRCDLSVLDGNMYIFRYTDDIAATGRKLTQQFLEQPLLCLRQKQDRWLTKLFDVGEYGRCEIILEWQLLFADEKWDVERSSWHRVQHKVQFSSHNWCVALPTAGGPVFCPQRLLEGATELYKDYPWLVESVNAVEHDKYYTI